MTTRVLKILGRDVPVLLTSSAAARRLDVSALRVLQLAALGRLRVHAVTSGRRHLFTLEDVERLRQEREAGPPLKNKSGWGKRPSRSDEDRAAEARVENEQCEAATVPGQ